MIMNILSFGEILWDVYPNERCIGGAPLNFITHTRMSGANGFLLSAIGADDEGESARTFLAKYRVDDRFVATLNEKQTGKCVVTLDKKGIPAYNLLTNVAYDYIPFDERLKGIAFDAIAFGTLALRSKGNRECLRKVLELNNCKKVYCDLNLRAPFFDKEIIEFCLSSADILKVSEDELSMIADMFAFRRLEMEKQVKELCGLFKNLETVLVTLGKNGSCAYEKGLNKLTYCKAVPTTVVSTVGAGDSFGAAFLVAYLSGVSIKESLQKGAERSALVIAQKGAIPFITE